MLREPAYANYADCCFPCRTDYANTLLLQCCLRGLRGIPGLSTILCSMNLFLLTKHTNYADYADETIIGAYAKLRHNYALQARGYASTLAVSFPS